MRRLIATVALALVGFYLAWPAWSAWRISAALLNEDEALLDSKVDFPSVRESLRPTVLAEITKGLDRSTGSLGPVAAAIGANIKSQMSGAMIDQLLTQLITPRSVIRLAKDGGDLSAAIKRAMAEAQVGGASNAGTSGGQNGGDLASVLGQVIGGLRQQKEPKAPTADQPQTTTQTTAQGVAGKRTFGLANIKGFRIAGPLGFELDVARDAAQTKGDATLGMSFTGADWKLTRVVPVI